MEIEKYGWEKCSDEAFEAYINKCKLFVQNNEYFKNFKRDIDYGKVLEGGEEIVGSMALNNIKNRNGNDILSHNLDRIKENDIYGNPILREYELTGYISPTTLRYVNNFVEIKHFVGNEKINKIAEVGGGYGGLCKTMSVLCDFDEYILIDLPPVIELCKKYINNFSDIKNKVTFISCEDLKNMEGIFDVDLFISDSAFAECSQEIQSIYTEKIVKNSKFVYVTFNASHFSNAQNEMEIFISKLKPKEINTYKADGKTIVTAK